MKKVKTLIMHLIKTHNYYLDYGDYQEYPDYGEYDYPEDYSDYPMDYEGHGEL